MSPPRILIAALALSALPWLAGCGKKRVEMSDPAADVELSPNRKRYMEEQKRREGAPGQPGPAPKQAP